MIAMMGIAAQVSATAQTTAPPRQSDLESSDSTNENTGPKAAIGEIVVTAQKRTENLQKVSAAITAVTGSDLKDQGINNILDVSGIAPNTSIGTNFGMAYIYIRGVGFDNIFNGAEASVAMHVDGAYIGKGEGQIGEFLDVERLEILRGPQGTLYGRNSTGGSVNIISRKPTEELDGYVRLSYGNYDNKVAEGAIGGPLIGDTVLGRIAGKITRRDGFGKNLTTGTDIDNARNESVRASLLFKLGGAARFLLTGSYYHARDHAYAPHYFDKAYPTEVAPSPFAARGIPTADPRDLASRIDPQNNRKVWSTTGNLEIPINDALTFKSITNYRNIRNLPVVDVGVGLNIAVAQRLDYDSFSQEFQLNIRSGALDGVVGAYYFHQKEFGDLRVCIYAINAGCTNPYAVPGNPPALLQQRGTTKTDTLAGFANFKISATDQLNFVLGARYSYEKRNGVSDKITLPATRGPFADKRSFTNFSPRVGVEFSPTDQIMLFANYSRGFKAGIYQTGAAIPVLKPETVEAYEAGIKSRFFDNQLQVNASAFWYDFSNLQVSRVIPSATGQSINIFENAAASRNRGVEAEVVWIPVVGLRFDGSLGYLDAKYGKYLTLDVLKANISPLVTEDAAGNRLPFAPKWSGSLRATYETEMSPDWKAQISGSLKYKSKIYFTPFNNDRISQDAVTTFDANLLVSQSSGFNVNLWIKNIGDKLVKASGQLVGNARSFAAQYQEPRTYGITLGYDF